MVRALAASLVVAAALLAVFSGREGGAQTEPCSGFEPFAFDAHEAYDNAGLYLTAIELAAAGEAVTNSTTPAGEPHGLAYPGLLRGSRGQRIEQTPDPSLRIPPTLLKAIVWVESEFGHADNMIPWGGVGPVKRSFDCGFGLGQITSGMANTTGNPSAKQALVGTHFVFNVAEAARLLAEKWNLEILSVVGAGDPASMEDWYYAVWAYNGRASFNHPQYQTANSDLWLDWLGHPHNPFLSPFRGDVWHCNDRTAPTWRSSDGVFPTFGYMDYTYPERVYGCMRHPPGYPERLAGDPQYAPTPWPEATPAAPDGEGVEGAAGEDAPQDGEAEAEAPWPAPGPDGVVRFWAPVQVNMPDPSIPAVAVAFSPQVYIACAETSWLGGCPEMYFPTSFPDLGVEPHQDPTPPVDPRLRDRLIGAPETVIRGPESVAIAVDDDGRAGSVRATVQNVGTWIAPFRIHTSAPWLVVRREGRERLHGGVTMGAETTVWHCVIPYCDADVTYQGRALELIITLDVEELPAGEDVRGTVVIEPLLGGGAIKTIEVRAGPSVERTRELEADPGEEELGERIVIPNVARD